MEERHPHPLHRGGSSLVRALGGHREHEASIRLSREASSRIFPQKALQLTIP